LSIEYVSTTEFSAADAHLAEGQFLLEEQTLNMGKSRIYRTGTEGELFPKQNGKVQNHDKLE
jgi:hypothetical protein